LRARPDEGKKEPKNFFAPLRAVLEPRGSENEQSFFASFCSQKEVLAFSF
jgi:hypothetical protein